MPCESCGEEILDDLRSKSVNGEKYCENCSIDFVNCGRCGEGIPEEKSMRNNSGHFCYDCWPKRKTDLEEDYNPENLAKEAAERQKENPKSEYELSQMSEEELAWYFQFSTE